jgi:DNA-binding IclR family transcriptional regulator
MPADDTGTLQGVSNALLVLDVLARHGPELGVADVSRHLSLPRSTAYRLLSTLESHGFVEQSLPTRKYRLGLKLFELAGIVWGALGLGEVALPHLEQLARETEETVHLGICDRDESMVIEKVDSPRAVYLRSHVGARRPYHSTATGKVLLAFMPTEQSEAIIERGLRRFTVSTVTDPVRLAAELAEIRRRGYAVNWGEFRDEAAGVAAPVRDRSGRPLAAVGVAAPIGRLTPQRIEMVARQTTACALNVSRRLGFSSALVPDGGGNVAAAR